VSWLAVVTIGRFQPAHPLTTRSLHNLFLTYLSIYLLSIIITKYHHHMSRKETERVERVERVKMKLADKKEKYFSPKFVSTLSPRQAAQSRSTRSELL
jgi:hypothetical protein